MKKFIVFSLLSLMVFAISVGTMCVITMVGAATPDASAEINYDVNDLCLALHTYVAGENVGTVDWDGFFKCVRLLS